MLNIKYQYFKGEAQSNDLFSKLVEAKENVTKHFKKMYILVTLSNHEKLIFLILSSQRNQSQKNAN